MKIQIRRGVFETNSSSVHTLTIAKGLTDRMIDRYEGSFVYIDELRTFGWENSIQSDFYAKLDYLSISFRYASREIVNDRTFEGEQKSLNLVLTWREMLQKILGKYNIEVCYTNTEVIWEEYNGEKYWELVLPKKYKDKEKESLREGYIDHGDELTEFVQDIMADEEKLLGFLFNTHSYIRTGNDNQEEDDFIPLPDVENMYTYTKEN